MNDFSFSYDNAAQTLVIRGVAMVHLQMLTVAVEQASPPTATDKHFFVRLSQFVAQVLSGTSLAKGGC